MRRPNVKLGIGINVEQHITDDIGVFFRGMYSDGQTEVDAYDPADRSIIFGAVAKGSAWHRHFDVTGAGFGMSWIRRSTPSTSPWAVSTASSATATSSTRRAEGVVEAFYSVNLLKAIWLTGDYQFLWNPAFNADRGPVQHLRREGPCGVLTHRAALALRRRPGRRPRAPRRARGRSRSAKGFAVERFYPSAPGGGWFVMDSSTCTAASAAR